MNRLTLFLSPIRQNLIALGAFALLWTMASMCFEDYIVPSPLAVAGGLGKLWEHRFVGHLLATLPRVAAGFALSLSLGTVIGVAASVLNAQAWVETLMVLFQVLPGLVLGIVFLMVFGVGGTVPVCLIVFLTAPLIAVNTAGALMKKDPRIENVIRSFGGGRRNLVRDLYHARPHPHPSGQHHHGARHVHQDCPARRVPGLRGRHRLLAQCLQYIFQHERRLFLHTSDPAVHRLLSGAGIPRFYDMFSKNTSIRDNAMLRVRNLNKHYKNQAIIQDLSFFIGPGARVCLFAPSGAGKTTLIHILSGLDEAFTGTIETAARRRSTVFQDPGLFWYKTVAENIRYPLAPQPYDL